VPACETCRTSNFTTRNFEGLSERKILALTISLEEEDERIYADLRLRATVLIGGA
jgi:hypothetical protein